MNELIKEQILQLLLDYRNNQGREYLDRASDLCNDLPELSATDLNAALSILMHNGLISFTDADDMPYGIRLTPMGLDYFNQKDLSQQSKKSERRWDLIKIGLSYLAGLLSGLFIQWVNSHYFR